LINYQNFLFIQMYNFKQILDFLRECNCNNNTEWMHANKEYYLEAKNEFKHISQEILDRLSIIDPTLKGLDIKHCIFRFNRDIRFSWDKSPYKDHFSVYYVPGGKKQVRAGYYFHLKPGDESLICCGVHCPPTPALRMIRQNIAEDGTSLEKIIKSRSFSKYYKSIDGECVKTQPSGIPHSDYDDLVKHKDFDACHYITDADITGPDIIDHIVEGLRAGKPLNDYFNEILSDSHIESVF
jgi:uncharacterized protein (TIGR02453 family)